MARLKGDLQDLYLHLDHYLSGNTYIAWYGQCRAEGMSHEDSIKHTVERFGLDREEWYQNRMKGRSDE